MALGYQNPCYLKRAQKEQNSLYNENLLLKEHDPPKVFDFEESLKLASESRSKMNEKEYEIKPIDYSKINKLFYVIVPQKVM